MSCSTRSAQILLWLGRFCGQRGKEPLPLASPHPHLQNGEGDGRGLLAGFSVWHSLHVSSRGRQGTRLSQHAGSLGRAGGNLILRQDICLVTLLVS